MKKLKKTTIYVLGILTIFSYFVIRKWPDESIQITFCDVGQGDSILIQQDFFQVLIDSGRDERVLGCLGQILPPWDRTIEVMILTHGDEDHIGFFGEIMGIYDTQFVFFPDTPKDTLTIKGVKEAIEVELTNGALNKQPILGQSISFPSGGVVTFLSATEKMTSSVSENDRSIVFLLEFGETCWLFTGDLEATGEQKLLKSGHLPLVDVLKVGHHGSASSSTMEFLSDIQPNVAVISVGANNKYGHPADSALANLRQIGSTVLRTDQLGDITLTTNGAKIWISRTHFRE